jgi:hypothetical protein
MKVGGSMAAGGAARAAARAKEMAVQEQIWNQFVQVLQERANLDPEKAQQVAQVAMDFAQQHLPELAQLAMGGRGGEGGQGGDLLGGLGNLFGGRS